MKIDDILYFAPAIRFSEVDLDGASLPHQFRDRIDGFYIEPARQCARCKWAAFAAGTLLVTCMDALAYLKFGGGVKDRFVKFAREGLRSFSTDNLAECFYYNFRNGLVHEGRLKDGAQFSTGIGGTVQQCDGILLVNPEHLVQEISSALDSYVDLLRGDDTERKKLAEKLRTDSSKEFRLVQPEDQRMEKRNIRV